MGIYDHMNSYVMVRLLVPDCPLDRRAARPVRFLFLAGAARRRPGANGSACATSSTRNSFLRS